MFDKSSPEWENQAMPIAWTRKTLAEKLKLKEPFTVMTARERRYVLDAAVFLSIEITTRKLKSGPGFRVIFL